MRGTPIDLDLVLRALSERGDVEVDALVYAEGEPREYPNVQIHRIRGSLWTRGVRPGFSARKLLCDLQLFAKAAALCRTRRYDLIHAGEEAVFFAMWLARRQGIPYVYDLDSSIAQQLVESRPWLAPLSPLFDRLEATAIRGASLCLPVCNALADLCRNRGAREVVTLHDISQIDPDRAEDRGALRAETGVRGVLVLYVGNLERYQGVDLLLEAFARVRRARPDTPMGLVVIGGTPAEIRRFESRSEALGVRSDTRWLPPRPLEALGDLLVEADILAAPRLRGINTPMKVFPYLHSGTPVLLTRLPTHTQLLDETVAMLAEPTPDAFAEALGALIDDDHLRARIGEAGRRFVEANHTYDAHRTRLHRAYDGLIASSARRPARRREVSKAAS